MDCANQGKPIRWNSVLSMLLLSLSISPGQVVISQVYGGGGNSGATYRNDFIELLNRGASPVSLAGWTVQYASATGTNWDRTPLSGTLQPGEYFLIQEAQGSAGSAPLPAPDASGEINMSATAGKIALVTNSTVLSGAAPTGGQIADVVGYGDTNYARGIPVGSLSNTTAAIRRSNGCADTGNNSADFSVGSPSPRNARSRLNPCASVTPPPTQPPPQITEAGIVNAASFAGAPVAPGEVVTVFGANLGPATLTTLEVTPDRQSVTKTLAGTRVVFDNTPAAIIYTSAGQLSAVVPYAVAGRTRTEVRVEYNGLLSNTATLAVTASSPGIFTLDSSGSGQAAALNQDYSFNQPSSPAGKGSVITLYATGGGQMIPEGEDGRVVTAAPPQLRQPVRVEIGGVDADVLYAGAAPFLVSGVLQINAKVPESLTSEGSVPVKVIVGSAASQPGVTVNVGAGSNAGPGGSGGDIEEKLERLRSEKNPPPLSEIPHDQIGLPLDWLALISWNTQTGGTSTSSTALRPPMVGSALNGLFSGTYQILAAQEIPNTESASLLAMMLPGGSGTWRAAFQDTTDTMDNGFWYRTGVTLRDSAPLLASDQKDSSGRWVTDPARAVHPPHVAQFAVGDFDFTLINVHLTFEGGDTAESAREMRNVLDYLDWYFNQPDHDPDVMVCGDFNIPSALSGQTGRGGITLDSIFNADPRFQSGERRIVATVHQPTSRTSAANGGVPANNYDHCVLSADTMEEYIQARRVQPEILTDHPEDPEERLTSDHSPIVVFFRTRGDGVMLDSKTRIR